MWMDIALFDEIKMCYKIRELKKDYVKSLFCTTLKENYLANIISL